MSTPEASPLPAHFEGEPCVMPLVGDARSTCLSVTGVKRLRPHALRAEPFSVALAGPLSPALGQGLYRLHHPQLGEIELFIVPTGRTASANEYEVIFN